VRASDVSLAIEDLPTPKSTQRINVRLATRRIKSFLEAGQSTIAFISKDQQQVTEIIMRCTITSQMVLDDSNTNHKIMEDNSRVHTADNLFALFKRFPFSVLFL
jgi:hypothetical protein